MKNLLLHISKNGEFCNDEHKMAAKIQIDNSLDLGWKKEDILLITNFPYEFMGVKSIVIDEKNCWCEHHWPATKIYTIVELFKKAFFEENELYWYHDFDCFQLNPFTEIEKEMEGFDMGVTNYGRMPRLCSASMFFKGNAIDIFEKIKQEVESSRQGEESRLTNLAEVEPRIKKLNITYAFHKFNLLSCDKIVDKPIKAAHFHLTPDKYDFYVRGNNKLGTPLIPKRLITIFHKYEFNK